MDAAAPIDRGHLLGLMASAPARLALAARRAAAETDPPAPGEWTAREVIGHLVAVESLVWQQRLDQLAAGQTPRWDWTEPGVSTALEAGTLDGALELLAGLRSATITRVGELDETGWARAGIHATYGRLDVAGLLGIAADHDDGHVRDLEARAGQASPP